MRSRLARDQLEHAYRIFIDSIKEGVVTLLPGVPMRYHREWLQAFSKPRLVRELVADFACICVTSL
jgi:hypothetical protein